MFDRLRRAARQPARAGSVFLSYVGIIAAVGYSANLASTSRSELRAEAAGAAQAIVDTGQQSIRSGCEFDNQRAKELRAILRRSVRSQQALLKSGSIDPSLARRNIRITQQDIRGITIRNCDRAAAELTTKEKK